MESDKRATALAALVLCLPLGTACGGDGGGGGGGGAGGADASAVDSDAGTGGDPDGGGPPGSGLLWVHGDLEVDGRTQLTVHVGDGSLPDTQALALPGGDSGEIAPSGSGAAGSYDVSQDGARVAFAADIAVGGRFDLYVAGVDGSGVTQVVAMEGAADVDQVRFSPDGARIAFTADADVDDQADAYVVDADATGAAGTRVSPERAGGSTDAALDVDEMMWSADSARLLVTGDFSEDGAQELWTTDVTDASPTPVALVDRDRIVATADIGPLGVVVPVLDADGRVVFKARIDADERYKLYGIDPDGQGEAVLAGSEIEREGGGSIADIGPVTASPDRGQIAFGADRVSGIYDVWVMPADGSAAPIQLTSGVEEPGSNPSFFLPLWWSADATRIAFVADYRQNGKDEPYVVPVAGGGQTHLATIGASGDGGQDAVELGWSPDGAQIYMIADHRVADDVEVFALDPDAADQDPALVFPVTAGGDASGLRTSR